MSILFRVVLVLGLAVSAAAQGTNAALSGTVTDDQGGVLPGVTVTVRNADTGTVRTVVTEVDGQYRVPALLPGRYDVTAELAGFSTVSAAGINLATSQEVRQNLTALCRDAAGDDHRDGGSADHRGDEDRGRRGHHAGSSSTCCR